MSRDVQRYMLAIGTAASIITGSPGIVRARLRRVPMASVCISSITQAELLSCITRQPAIRDLPLVIKEFLLRVDILPWDEDAAQAYAKHAAVWDSLGLRTMDALVAAHAVGADATLVTNQPALLELDFLEAIDWTAKGR